LRDATGFASGAIAFSASGHSRFSIF
jgi:hypothetical protein